MPTKINSASEFNISSVEDFEKFARELPKVKAVNGKKIAKATVADVLSFDTSKLTDLNEVIYLSGTNVHLFLQGNVGPYTATLLSRRFKRVGFEGRTISLQIPSSLNPQDKANLTDKIVKCAKSEAEDKVRTLIAQGVSISTKVAKDLGMLDQIIDLSKRRGQPKSATVAASGQQALASDDNSVPENQTAKS
jgi:hypothetical protein